MYQVRCADSPPIEAQLGPYRVRLVEPATVTAPRRDTFRYKPVDIHVEYLATLKRLDERLGGSRSQEALQVFAPAQKLKYVGRFNLLVATEDKLPGFLGDITLKCDRSAVNTERLEAGILNLCADHRLDDPVGRVTSFSFGNGELRAQVELATTRRGRESLEEINQGLRVGVSPAILIDSYDKDEDGEAFDIVVTRYSPYELSLTAGPRNYRTRIEGRFSMNSSRPMSLEGVGDMPEVVNTSDLLHLSLVASRKPLTDGKITDARKREQLTLFFREYDERIGRGESRSVAAHAARDIAGIPAR